MEKETISWNIVSMCSRCDTRYWYLLGNGLFECRKCTLCYWVPWYQVPFCSLVINLFKVFFFFIVLYTSMSIFRNFPKFLTDKLFCRIPDCVESYLTNKFQLCYSIMSANKMFKVNNKNTRTRSVKFQR